MLPPRGGLNNSMRGNNKKSFQPRNFGGDLITDGRRLKMLPTSNVSKPSNASRMAGLVLFLFLFLFLLFLVLGSGFWVLGSGFWVLGSGFWLWLLLL